MPSYQPENLKKSLAPLNTLCREKTSRSIIAFSGIIRMRTPGSFAWRGGEGFGKVDGLGRVGFDVWKRLPKDASESSYVFWLVWKGTWIIFYSWNSILKILKCVTVCAFGSFSKTKRGSKAFFQIWSTAARPGSSPWQVLRSSLQRVSCLHAMWTAGDLWTETMFGQAVGQKEKKLEGPQFLRTFVHLIRRVFGTFFLRSQYTSEDWGAAVGGVEWSARKL